MKVRSLLAATATVVAATGGFLMAAPVAAYAGTSCGTTDPLPATVTGTVSTVEPADWWSFTTSAPKIVTMLQNSGDPDLKIMNATCGSVVCYPYTIGTETCQLPAGTYKVGVLYFSGPGGVAGYTLSVTSPACSDGIDNDDDGFTDYPSDAGCGSTADTTESAPCTTTAGVTRCVGVSTGAFKIAVAGYSASALPNGTIDVYGYVRRYLFEVAGQQVEAACVDTVVDGTEVSPCAAAGGTRVSTVTVLQAPRVTTYEADVKPTDLVRICDSELEATVNGAGVASLKLVTVC